RRDRQAGQDTFQIQSQLTSAARPAGLWTRLRRWTERRPAEAVAVLLGGVAAVGIPAGMWMVERSGKAQLQSALTASVQSARTAKRATRDAAQALARAEEAAVEARASEEKMQVAAAAAARSEAESEDVLQFVLKLFHDLPPLGSTAAPPTALDLLGLGASTIEGNESMSPEARARVMLALGTSLRKANDHDRALELLSGAALAFSSDEGIASRRRYAAALDGEARCLQMLGRWEEAIKSAQLARDVAKDVYDQDAPELIVHLALAAEVLVGTPRALDALPLREQLVRHLQTHRPSDRIEIARARAGLGQSYFDAASYFEARAEYAAALEVLREVAPPNDHYRIQATLRSANIPLVTGDIPSAQALFTEGRDLAKEAFGPDDELTLAAEASLADAKFRGNDHVGATEAYETILPRMKEHFGETLMYGTTIVSFLRALTAQGRSSDVVRWAKKDRWVESLTSIFGTGHPQFGFVNQWLIGCALGVGEYETAIDSLKAMILFAEQNPSAHAEHRRALMMIGSLYMGPLQDDEQARSWFLAAHELIGSDLCFFSPSAETPLSELGLEARQSLAEIERRAGNEEEAARWDEEVAARQVRVDRAKEDGVVTER
ncbi:MAG: tetratricopeptide repeat protein, partial [Planctomycetota bacterium]